MTVDEFITQFDIYYNNIASNAAPSIDNYEKSVFLTKAQLDIVIELYNGRGIPGLSFESTEEARLYLRNLTSVHTFTEDFDNISLPKDLMFITFEEVKFKSEDSCIANTRPRVVPIRQDYIHSTLNNPFRGPSKNRVLRSDDESTVKLYSLYPLKSYKIHYLRFPQPIILEDLYELTIDGKSEVTECELDPVLHKAILDRAVLLAKVAYIGKE